MLKVACFAAMKISVVVNLSIVCIKTFCFINMQFAA